MTSLRLGRPLRFEIVKLCKKFALVLLNPQIIFKWFSLYSRRICLTLHSHWLVFLEQSLWYFWSQILLVSLQLLQNIFTWTNLNINIFTVLLRDFTSLKASSRLSFLSFIRNAITKAADRLTPATQWTKTWLKAVLHWLSWAALQWNWQFHPQNHRYRRFHHLREEHIWTSWWHPCHALGDDS